MQVDAATLEKVQNAAPEASSLLRAAFSALSGRIAILSSFGAESALLLALAAEIDPNVPVLFLETGKHFPETLAYRADIAKTLGLTDVRDIRPAAEQLAARDPQGQLWAFDPDACCALRKVEPLDLATLPFDALVTGRKRQQAHTRSALNYVEQPQTGPIRINPLADWTLSEIEAEMARRGLPRHPLSTRGYPSIGCAPCTQPVAADDDPRSGRWAGLSKTECGIHRATSSTVSAEI